MFLKFQAWLIGRDGATAIEYGLIAAGIALVIAGVIFVFGSALETFFYEDMANALDGPS